MLELITGVTGGIVAVAIACVTYFSPKHAAKINTAISVVGTAVIEVAAVLLT